MNRSSVYCSNIKELSRYLRISCDKAIDLVNVSGFPKGVFLGGNVFLKAQVINWMEQHINILQATDKATDKATRAITHIKA